MDVSQTDVGQTHFRLPQFGIYTLEKVWVILSNICIKMSHSNHNFSTARLESSVIHVSPWMPESTTMIHPPFSSHPLWPPLSLIGYIFFFFFFFFLLLQSPPATWQRGWGGYPQKGVPSIIPWKYTVTKECELITCLMNELVLLKRN